MTRACCSRAEAVAVPRFGAARSDAGRHRPAALLAACALATLAAMPVRAAMPGAVMWVAMCGGGMQPIPINDKSPPGRDCPGACHATCTRSLRSDGGGDSGDDDAAG